jgi:hypothetical protein
MASESMPRPLRVLITNAFLKNRTGTEVVVHDLVLGLRAAGHLPMVYSPELGDLAREIAAVGVPVSDDLHRLPHRPDIIHGHHHVETVQALEHFPDVCAIYVCHDRLAWQDSPPLFPRILRYVAVDLNCRERLAEAGCVPEDRIAVIYNWVRTDRFLPRSPLPPRPTRALIFSNYAGIGTHLEPIREACGALGIPVDVIGSGTGTAVDRPEERLGAYDVVFAKARCALEAMATGAAVILCDTRGLGPLVTLDEVAELRPWNFGMRCLGRPLEARLIMQEIGRYDPTDARAVGAYIREHANFEAALDRYLRLYADVRAERRSPARTGTAERREYLCATVRRLGELERHAGGSQPAPWMPGLSCVARARMRIRIRTAPARVPCGATFSIQVELENRTALTLGTFPPFPLHFACRWLSRLTRHVLVREGERTPLPRGLGPGQTRAFTIRTAAPAQPGTYRVRATLVQEGLQWLDRRLPRVFADTTIIVV